MILSTLGVNSSLNIRYGALVLHLTPTPSRDVTVPLIIGWAYRLGALDQKSGGKVSNEDIEKGFLNATWMNVVFSEKRDIPSEIVELQRSSRMLKNVRSSSLTYPAKFAGITNKDNDAMIKSLDQGGLFKFIQQLPTVYVTLTASPYFILTDMPNEDCIHIIAPSDFNRTMRSTKWRLRSDYFRGNLASTVIANIPKIKGVNRFFSFIDAEDIIPYSNDSNTVSNIIFLDGNSNPDGYSKIAVRRME